jgi:type IV secretion system protein VirD4
MSTNKTLANHKVLRFEPTWRSPWNALDTIRIGTQYETADVQDLAKLIVEPDRHGLVAMPLLVGVILHALYKRKLEGVPASLSIVERTLSDPNKTPDELWMEMASYHHINGESHPAIRSAAVDMMQRPDEEAASVLSTVKSYLSLFSDPIIPLDVSAQGVPHGHL